MIDLSFNLMCFTEKLGKTSENIAQAVTSSCIQETPGLLTAKVYALFPGFKFPNLCCCYFECNLLEI